MTNNQWSWGSLHVFTTLCFHICCIFWLLIFIKYEKVKMWKGKKLDRVSSADSAFYKLKLVSLILFQYFLLRNCAFIMIFWIGSRIRSLYMTLGGSKDSGYHVLSESIWFVWSKTLHNREKLRYHDCDTQHTDITNRKLGQYSAETEFSKIKPHPLHLHKQRRWS